MKNQTNVLIADWGKLAQLPCYPTAVFNTKQAGECIGEFLTKFKSNFESIDDFKEVHMIGFSLGAHVVSYASNVIQDSLGILMNRITGKCAIVLTCSRCYNL